MSPFYHALNTGTLAAWLSVTGFGTVGVLLQDWRAAPPPPATTAVIETQWVEPEILLGDADPTTDPNPAPPAADTAPPEPLPAPPEMPEAATPEPLPEIPDLPPPQATPTAKAAKPVAAVPRPSPPRSTAAARPPSTATGATGTPAGTGMSQAARLAAGRMPSPAYPVKARRKGQTGTVTVEFTVDTTGRVIAAHAKNPSPWPLLDEEAVRTVRRWRFPPGGLMTLRRPIVFQLR
jgi:protein TonB